MDQETREAFTSLAADLKQHINERHSELVGRFDAVDDRLKRVETSVAYLENQEKGRNRPGGGGSIHGNRKMAAKGRGG